MGQVQVQSKTEILAEVKESFGSVPTWLNDIPEQSLAGFWGLFRDFYMAETAIPNKYKELIGLAVSGATRCKYCQLFHAEGARLHGATEDEIREAAMMSGVTMLGSTFLNAMGTDYDVFAKETQQIVDFVKKQQASAPPPTPGKAKGDYAQH